jgi:hypothetical protein
MRRTIGAFLAAICVTVCFLSPAALATPGAGGGVIHACMLTKGKKATRGLLRVVPAAKSCKKRKGEKPIEWSIAGPSGQAGAQGSGAAGPPGSPGATGAQGARGEAGSQGSAAALEKSVTETLTSQSLQIQSLTTKVSGLTGELLSLEGGVGSLGTTVSGLGGKVSSLEGTVGGVQTTVGNLGTSVTNLSGSVGTLETGLTGVKSTVTESCTQLTTLTSQSNAMGTTVNGVNTLLKGVPLLSALNLPSAPTALTPFACK